MIKKNLLSTVPLWIFDPRSPSGSPEGGFESIKSIGKLTELEIIIRESIQNSKDRMLTNTLNMTYKLYELDGNYKEEYLKNLNFKELEYHLKSASEGSLSSESKYLAKGLKYLKNKNSKLRILIIEDFDCEGLTGVFGEKETDEEDSNFSLLCKGNMATIPKSKKGGSWGVGKKSFIEASLIRTLLFSSIPNDTNKLRVFGRTITPTHKTPDGKSHRPPGYFGLPNINKDAALSFTNPELAKKLLLNRENGVTGTSIAIVGFTDSSINNIDEFASKIEEFIQKYYWPVLEGLLPDQKKLNVTVKKFKNTKRVFKKDINTVTIDKYKNFINAYKNINNKDNVESENTSTTTTIKFKVKQREGQTKDINKHPSFDSNLQLDIFRGSLNDNSFNGSANKTAYLRGFGQIVKYFDSKEPNGPLPYFAVLSVGNAKNKIKQDNRLLEFEEEHFRMLENELHDEWKNNKNFKAFYNTPSTVTPALKDMELQIINKIRKLCGVDVTSGTKGPKGVSKKLSLGGNSDDDVDREKIYKVYAEGHDKGELKERILPDGTLNLDYKIKKKNEILSDTKVKLDYTLRSDSGESIKIPLENIEITYNNQPIKWELKNNQIRFLMKEDMYEVNFKAIANPNLLFENMTEFKGYDFKKIAYKRTLLSFK